MRWLAPLVLLLQLAGGGRVAAASDVDIPHARFVLDNGLTLIVHEDHKAPIVAVNVWYRVGSKNERPGKTGFAHLFEHLMFNGSEHFNDDYFKPFDRVGATEMNGTTNFDRTNYFQNVPASALDVALWMESDRMGHLLGAIDQARLDEQRGVVQNEKRQGENQPYGKALRLIFENSYPQGHPYSWSVIGSLEDLDAATLEDVHDWFRTYYGAANAVLVVAGDVDTARVRTRVEHYFGDIPAGPPLGRHRAWVAKRSGTRRQTLQDRVPQARIYKAWNMPPIGSDDALRLELVSDLLTKGKNSRLFERLVYREQVATAVDGFAHQRDLGGLFVIFVTAQPGQELGRVERLLDEELERLLAEGPTPRELERVRTAYRAAFLRGIERVGGFGGKSDILARYEVHHGRPDGYRHDLERVAQATASELRSAAREWLADGALVLEVQPFPDYATTASAADRSSLPEVERWPEPAFPRRERVELANGLELLLARRAGAPVVEIRLVVDAGFAADVHGLPGTASLTLDMLDEGTRSRSALQISEELALAGATLSAASDLDASVVSLSALPDKLDLALDLLADVVLNPAFAEAEFERLRKQRIAQIQREKSTPQTMALRALPRLLYGADHAYGLPLTGSGTEASLAAMTARHLAEFHRSWFDPARATLIVVGDVTLDTLRPAIERRFAAWKPAGSPEKKLGTVRAPAAGVYLIDRPDSLQSVILVGGVVAPKSSPQDLALVALNEVLGGSFTARINMNLREDKHWSYGARSVILDARGPRPFYVSAPVQTDKTKEAMVEIRRELVAILGDRPPTADELARAKDRQTLTLPGRWETARAVAGAITELVQFGLGDDYWTDYPGRVRALTLADLAGAAGGAVPAEHLVWVVVGDRAKIEAGIRELDLGEPRRISADGDPIEPGSELARK